MRWLLPLVLVCGVLPAAAQPSKPNPAPAPKKLPPKKMDITAKILGEKPGRPPLSYYSLEVKIHNPSKDARWYVLPSKLPPPKSAVGVDTMEPRESKDVMLARFLGTAGFYAVKVAGGATLTITKLELQVWGDAQPSEYPVQVVADIQIGGKSIATWFDHDPTAKGTTIDAAATSAGKAKKTPDGKEVPVVISGDTLAVPLAN